MTSSPARHTRLALIALLMFTQIALSIHQADLAAHANGDTCEWCLASAPLGAALLSAGLAALPPALPVQPFGTFSVFFHIAVVPHRGRDPPAYSA